MVYKKLIFILLLLMSTALHAAFFKEHREGWHWYEDPILEPLPETKAEKLNPNTPLQSLESPTEIIKAYQKELEKRLHQAWVTPTPINIQSYQEMQKDLMQRSQKFSETWMQVVFNNPHLDHTLIVPVNQKSRHIYLDNEKERIAETIRDLKEDYGLFFFFSSQCDYCHQFAPIVQQFAKNYEWEVLNISIDNGTIPGLTNVVMNNGLSEKWQVAVLPALFAVNPKTGHILPVAYGLTSLDQMENRIMTLLKGRL